MESISLHGSPRLECPGKGAGPSSAGRLVTPCEWGDLRVLRPIGFGILADVYLAHETALDRPVALKLYHSETDLDDQPSMRALGNVQSEAAIMARLADPNVVRVYGTRSVAGRIGIWMELIRGCTLQEILQTQGSLSADEARAVGRSVCAALVAVHKAGLLHRDIKAGNIMREEGGRYVLMDFGVGAVVSESGEVEGISGTPAYIAPEVRRDATSTIASDLYSVGVLLFHLVTGRFPGALAAPAPEESGPHAAKWPAGTVLRLEDYRPDLPPELAAVIERAIDPDPGRRFRTAGDMLRALGGQAPAQQGGEIESRAGDDNRVQRKPRRRVTPLKIVIGLVPTLLGLWLLVWIARQILRLVFGH